MSRIVITGLGVITSIGHGPAQTRVALSSGQCGISTLENFPSKYSGLLPCGEIKWSTEELISMVGDTGRGITRTALLADLAFSDAIADAHLSEQQISSPATALINGNTVAGMCLTDELYSDSNKAENGSEYLASYDCGSVGLYIQTRYNVGGIIDTINTACSSSANAIMYGARLIKNGFADRAIVGGEDSLAKFTINGFNSLHILSDQPCRPFDKDRKGLNLGEGAAFIVLEKMEDASDKKIYAELTGYGNANDAFHPSSLSENGDGPFLSMSYALQAAKLNAGDIDFINAHGTGTENNDEVESKAMLRLFKHPPAFTSTKSNTGHTLGAAGAVEAVFSILNLEWQEIYPAVHFQFPIESTSLVPVKQFRKLNVRNVMSNSFGFGGNCTSLIFSKV